MLTTCIDILTLYRFDRYRTCSFDQFSPLFGPLAPMAVPVMAAEAAAMAAAITGSGGAAGAAAAVPATGIGSADGWETEGGGGGIVLQR